MKLKYYFGAAVIAASALVAAVILGWVDSSAATLATIAVPLFLVGVAAAWFLDHLDRRLAELSVTAHALSPGGGGSGQDSVSVIARSLDGMQQRMTELQTRFDQQRAIAEHAIDAMWVLQLETNCIVDVNQSFINLSGLGRDALIGMAPERLIAPADESGDARNFIATLVSEALSGERVVADCRLLVDGDALPCELRAAKLPSLPGRTLIGGTLIDLRDRLRNEQGRAERRAFEALISQLSTDMIGMSAPQIDAGVDRALGDTGALKDADRGYVYQFDETGENLVCTHEWHLDGVASRREPGRTFSLVDYPYLFEHMRRGEALYVPRVDALPESAAAERDSLRRFRTRSAVLVPLRPRGTQRGFVGFDWTRGERSWPAETRFLFTVFGEMIGNLLARQRLDEELSRQHEALERSISELTRSNSELQRFAYAASHDLQEPLRAISGFSEMLKRRYRGRLDPTADEYLDFVRDAATRMRGMIVNLLDYSRIDASPRPFEPCDLNEVLRLALANLHASIEELNAHVLAPELPMVLGDPSQLLQLLQNLLSNALKFHAEAEPVVQISVRRDDGADQGGWHFVVRDNGLGIRDEDLERVFEVFKRLHAADRYPGSGIGLSVCKRIIERHHGRIWAEAHGAEATEGVGASFHFTLPVLQANAAAAA